MSQTLTKPILLDETGQAIAGKLDTNSAAIIEALDDIKDAIGTSSEFIPVKIQVVTPPTKTIYKVGERLNLSGMVVNLVGTNGVQIDVTSACTFSPANNTVLTVSDTAVAVAYLYQHEGTTFTTSQALTIQELSSIAVTTPPVKISYQTGEALDLTGIVVTATYSDGTTANVTADCTFSPANGTTLTSSDTSVTVTYTESGTTKTTTTPIGVKELSSISVTTPPTTYEYVAGDTLDLTGMVVTALYDDGSTLDVTSRCVYSPADGDTLTASDTSVTISYTEGAITKTTTQALQIIPIYGVEWDGTATTSFTRTGSAASFVDPVAAVNNGNGSSPFDTIQPWAGMVREELTDAGTMVKIPKFYYKWTLDGSKVKLEICSQQPTGFFCSPAHADRGDGEGERDYVYVSAYNINSTRKSQTGKSADRQDISSHRYYIKNVFTDSTYIYQWDIAMYWTICMLYLVEYANWDAQATIGAGEGDGNTGLTDGMTYHTGTAGSTRDATRVSTRYRYIENLWGRYGNMVDGIYYNQNKVYILKDPSTYRTNDGELSGGTEVATLNLTGSSYQKQGLIKSWQQSAVQGFEYALFFDTLVTNSPDYQTYVSDQIAITSGSDNKYITMGNNGNYGQYGVDWQIGLFYQYVIPLGSSQYATRIMKLPANS